ncbi:hypothetical protein RR48_09093 [Papilio machaon]|uniref:Uncharacterized protein n=1 Tax=Papilio machaon TaxID=76193 RepID=A0A194RGL1_PAPMA|nr:hypothetical protein RR48_09093 [Papilio machaon]
MPSAGVTGLRGARSWLGRPRPGFHSESHSAPAPLRLRYTRRLSLDTYTTLARSPDKNVLRAISALSF